MAWFGVLMAPQACSICLLAHRGRMVVEGARWKTLSGIIAFNKRKTRVDLYRGMVVAVLFRSSCT